MAARLTKKQAQQLGLPGVEKTTPRGKRTNTKKAVPNKECLPNRCCTCGEIFTTEAGERRHAEQQRHLRFECVIAGVEDRGGVEAASG